MTERRLSWFSATLGPCRLSRQLGALHEACPQVPLPYHSKRCVLYASLLPPCPRRPSVVCPSSRRLRLSPSSSLFVRVVVVCPSVFPPVRRRSLFCLSPVRLSSPVLVRCGVPPAPLGLSFRSRCACRPLLLLPHLAPTVPPTQKMRSFRPACVVADYLLLRAF